MTDRQLHEAEEGLVRLLHKKRFPREWIERNVPDIMGQARTDFAARLAAGKEDETVGLLVVIGYRRATKVLDAQLSRPPTTSLETVFHLADEATPTPEEEAIDHDRQERVVEAMSALPERERKLMALVYFDGKSVRDAGRRLGWGKSSADRHHRAALEKLHELLDRSLLSPEIAIPAYVAARHWDYSPLRVIERWLAGAGETAAEGALAGGGRLNQAAEGASAAAGSGGGRAVTGVCGAAVAVCLTGAATGVVGPGVGGLGLDGGAPRPVTHHRAATRGEVPAPVPATTSPPAPASQGSGPGAPAEPAKSSAEKAAARRPAAAQKDAATSAPRGGMTDSGTGSAAPAATPRQTAEEFGVEGGEPATVPEAKTEPAAPPAPAPSPARTSGDSSSSSSTSGGSSSGTEFGM